MLKKELRQEIQRRKRQLTEEELRQLSLPLMQRLLSHPKIRGAKTVLMYYSLPDEVYTHDAIDQLVEAEKEVLLPVVINDHELEIRQYRSPKDMKEGSFHIMEPIGDRFCDYPQIDVAVIPGMSFDPRGNRLGRGKGYYDRFLEQIPQAYKIGICFDFQKWSEVPTDPYDVKVDEVI